MIPPQRHDAPVACPAGIYHNRHRVERLWARPKEWRAMATRTEKRGSSFMGGRCLAAALEWLRNRWAPAGNGTTSSLARTARHAETTPAAPSSRVLVAKIEGPAG
ncbi:transposase [Geminicoccus roseus]|uniref:transposase n=1 Tax=Geminicoccus roseus TaxID=404900 RepID=UPI0038993C54